MLKEVWGPHFKGVVRLNAIIFVVLIYLIIFQGLSQVNFVKALLCIGFAETIVGMGYLITYRMVIDYRKNKPHKTKPK